MNDRNSVGRLGSLLAGAPGFCLLICGLVFAQFPQVVLGVHTFFYGDFSGICYPNAYYQRECFWQGEFPFWNPYNGAGAPFMASWYTMVYYPPALFYLLMPLKQSLGWFCLLHLVWGGLGAYVLTRQWTKSFVGSAFAGVVFSSTGLATSSLLWPAITAAQSWIPWILWANQRAVNRGGRWLLFAILFGTMQMMTGAPENILLTWGLAVIFFLYLGRKCDVDFWRRCLRLLIIIFVIALISCIQLVPFAEYLLASQRMAGFWREESAVPGWGWGNLISPLFYTLQIRYGLMKPPVYLLIISYYCGATTMMLFFWSILSGRRGFELFLAIIAIFSAVMALGSSGYLLPLILKYMPYLSLTRYPFKYLYIAAFCFSLVGALALGRLDSRIRAGPSMRFPRLLLVSGVVTLLALALLTWFDWKYPLNDEMASCFSIRWPNALERGILLIVFMGVLTLWTKQKQHFWRVLIGLLVVLVAWVDLATHQPSKLPTVPVEVFEPRQFPLEPAPVLGQGRGFVYHNTEALLFSLNYTNPIVEVSWQRKRMAANLNLLENYGKYFGNDTLYLRGQYEVSQWLNIRTNLGNLGDFLGITHQFPRTGTQEPIIRTNTMPMISCGQSPVFLDYKETAFAVDDEQYDLRRYALLPRETRQTLLSIQSASGLIHTNLISAHCIDFSVEANEPLLVTIAQSYFSPWQAEVNGRKTPVYRANHAYQAIQVPGGYSKVRLCFKDHWFLMAATVSILTLLLILIVVFRIWGKEKKGGIGA